MENESKPTFSALKQCAFIREEFSEYLRSTFDIRDKAYKDLFFERLEQMESELYRGPFLKTTLPFASGKSIGEMVEEGAMHPDFLLLGGIDKIKDRPLYAHQEKAIRKVESGRSVVITTGTGSGKTECFLFPILDSIIKDLSVAEHADGIRAIMLFPMNALINDQIDRIRAYLKGYPKIKFAFFTGDTPESVRKKDAEGGVSNELLSREQIRENPPHILFTNFSMLEYLLIRPEDKGVVSTDALSKLRYFVMDEAHTYKGTLAIEISFLLKRVMGMAKHHPQFVLTSATLGGGKDDLAKIVEFAENLTGCKFFYEDVIFADPFQMGVPKNYIHISASDIEALATSSKNEVEVILSKYGLHYDATYSLENILYDALSRDELVHDFYDLCEEPIEFKRALAGVRKCDHEYSGETLNSLICLISKATAFGPWGKKLFDIKYHMFIKAPDACFITLGDDPQLSLVNCVAINGKKAFKIGICQNCKTPYVMGRSDNNDHILMTDDEIDIDETYAEKQSKLEYYLISSLLSVHERENVLSQNDMATEYIVCSKCGKIRKKDGSDGVDPCECGPDYEVELIRYQEKILHGLDEDEALNANNISKCPVCDYSGSGSGCVIGFHVGKDRATALLSQILYQSMPQKVESFIPAGTMGGLFGKPKPIERKEPKQFLAFSDGRQQAAFFSKFVNENNDRFLKKAIVWNILKANGHNPISVSELLGKVQAEFKKLGCPDDVCYKQAWSTILWELLLVDGRNSAEGLGLFYYELKLPDLYYDDETIESALAEYGFALSGETFRTIIRKVLHVFRTVPAIEYDDFCSVSEREDLLGYRSFKNYVALRKTPLKKSKAYAPDEDRNVRSLLPVSVKQSNKILDYIMNALGYSKDQATKLIEMVWSTITSEDPATGILVKRSGEAKTDAPEMAYRIKAASYVLRSFKEKGAHIYQCNKCMNTTLFNIGGVCSEGDCSGALHEIKPDEAFATNYYRKQYQSKPLEVVRCEEHTAQIHGEEGKRRQIQFKEKKINILSCSTTFEMGVDLGSLTTVFMRNVPPTPANYAQRAGRAGRRSDTPAFILTFCSSSSHDFAFFSDPPRMIAGIVDVPYFNRDNQKIILRHIVASALGFFFREEKKSKSFPTIDEFIKDGGFQGFEEYIESKSTDLGQYIDDYVLGDTQLIQEYGEWKWLNYFDDSSSALAAMVSYLRDTIEDLQDGIVKAKAENKFSLAQSYQEALDKLKDGNSLVTYMSRHGVIPGYGFPVDNVDLQIYNESERKMDTRYDLNRNLAVAISEYAPDSEVIVDNKKYTSHYICMPHSGAAFPPQYYVKCDCGAVVVSQTKIQTGETCPCCKKSLDSVLENQSTFIRPDRGFIATGKNKQTRRMKPARTYASEIFYVGRGLASADPINVNGTLKVEAFKNERLLVINESNFYVCPKCGYSKVVKGKSFPHITQEHEPISGVCTNKKLDLTHLGYLYMTDVVKIVVDKKIEFRDRDTALSVLYALLIGVSTAFEIDRDDIDGIIFRTTEHENYQIILFDRSSGGAGHVKALVDKVKLRKALGYAHKAVSHACCNEDTSCYNCLRTYNNQRLHRHLIRGLARDKLLEIIDSIDLKKETFSVKGPKVTLGASDDVFSLADCLDDEHETALFKMITDAMSAISCIKPEGWGYTLQSNQTASKYTADFYWAERNLLLFAPSHSADFEYLSKQSTFDCYLMDEKMDLNALINTIRK